MTTNQGIQIFKWSVVAIAIIFLFLLFRRCGNVKTKNPVKADTSTVKKTIPSKKVDTFYLPSEPIVVYRNTPKYKNIHDTLESFNDVDTANILKEYYATKYYKDEIDLGEAGKISLYDTLSENRIEGRGYVANLNKVIETKTINVPAKKKAILYFGMEVLGNQQDFITASGVGLSLKTKNDKIYGVKALLTKQGNPVYGFQFMLPIRLRKSN